MKKQTRIEAVKLRQGGKSIKEIATLLSISISTSSRWCAGIRLSKAQQSHLSEKRRVAGLKSLAPWILKNKAGKIEDIEIQKSMGMADIGAISERDLFMIGLGLYWGEGYKKGSQEWGFTNSDPEIIRVMITLMICFYKVDQERFRAHITINELYRGESARIHAFWSKQVGIPPEQFSSPTFIKGFGKVKRSPETYNGTLRLKIRNSTSLRRRVLASINSASILISQNSLN